MRALAVFGVLFGALFVPSLGFAQYQVVAIGDSQAEPNSAFVRYLQEELGSEYQVRAEGRRGWSTTRWLRSGDFGERCRGADVVLISLGGNDIAQGRSWKRIYTNISLLVEQIPLNDSGHQVIYHMVVPRFYFPRLSMSPDGIHLSRLGARRYAQIVAPNLRVVRYF